MRRVFKYPIEVTDLQAVRLPLGSDILSVGEQRGDLVLWAMVDDDEEVCEERLIRIVGTGHPFGDFGRYPRFVCTVQTQIGLVWHIFTTR